jgi:hypothetical protein
MEDLHQGRTGWGGGKKFLDTQHIARMLKNRSFDPTSPGTIVLRDIVLLGHKYVYVGNPICPGRGIFPFKPFEE